MQKVSSGSRIFRFSTFELDGHAGELRKQGVKVKLQEQPLRVLEMLLASRGQIVTREELRIALWAANTLVDFDHGLNKAINKLREALGDSAESPRFIETLARRGYRFLGNLSGDPRQIRSLLILPLENLPHEPEQEYFAEGLTEALTTCLAKISALRVISRTTAVIYKRANKPLPDIARELGVDGVVEGTVLRSEGRVRISAQLIHAPTDTHLWAESYERDMRDILALQAEVAGAIAKEIQVKVTAHERTQLAYAPVVNPEVHDAYLRGRHVWNKRSADGYQSAIQFFNQVITREPGHAAAHAGLADSASMLGWFGFTSPEEGCGKAQGHAARALEIDPGLGQAHASLAWATLHYDYNFLTAEKEFRRSIELDPRNPIAHYWFALALAFIGRFEEAIVECGRAFELDPFSPGGNPILACIYWLARRYDQLIAQGKKTLQLYPEFAHMHWGLGAGYLETSNFQPAIAEMQLAVEYSRRAPTFLALLAETYAVAGYDDKAQQIVQDLQQRSNHQYVTPYMIGRVYAALGQIDEAFGQLEAAYEEHAAWMVMLKRDPRLDGLRSDPRYDALLRRMNFPS